MGPVFLLRFVIRPTGRAAQSGCRLSKPGQQESLGLQRTVTAFFPTAGDSPEQFKSFVSTIEAQFATAITLEVVDTAITQLP
jgi:hypothetical protein